MKEVVAGLAIALLIGAFAVVGKGISVYNTNVDYSTKIEAKQEANKANFDTMWKKIKQVSQVSDKYKDGLAEVLAKYTAERKVESDQLLMNWIKEAVPQFDSSIYKQINNIVVSSRDDFYNNQVILIDLSRAQQAFIKKFPNNVFCAFLHIEPTKIQTVTSSVTTEAFETGEENDIKL